MSEAGNQYRRPAKPILTSKAPVFSSYCRILFAEATAATSDVPGVTHFKVNQVGLERRIQEATRGRDLGGLVRVMGLGFRV